MIYNVVGASNIRISALGMGCWAYGGGSYWGEQAQEDVDAVVRTALEYGVNYFDTAEVYNDGGSERSLGIALKGIRHKAVIGTKISTSNVRRDVLIQHCEDSLKRLQTDYIDIYMLHWPVNQKSIEHFSTDSNVLTDIPEVSEVFGTLNELKKQGKIREIGVSNHGIEQMKDVMATGTEIAVNELPYNLISRAIEQDILPYCVEHDIGVLGYMAYQQGILTGNYDDFSALRPSQAHSRHFSGRRGGEESRHGEDGVEEEMLCMFSEIKKIANALNVSVATVSLAYAMSRKGISSTLVGSRTVKQLDMNIEIASYKLTPDILDELDKISKPVWDKLGNSPDYYENRKYSRIR